MPGTRDTAYCIAITVRTAIVEVGATADADSRITIRGHIHGIAGAALRVGVRDSGARRFDEVTPGTGGKRRSRDILVLEFGGIGRINIGGIIWKAVPIGIPGIRTKIIGHRTRVADGKKARIIGRITNPAARDGRTEGNGERC